MLGFPHQDLRHGLQGWWPLNDQGGNQVVDISGNELHGSRVDGKWWPDCYEVTSTSTRIVVNNTNNKLTLVNDFSISAWIFPLTTSNTYHFIRKGNPLEYGIGGYTLNWSFQHYNTTSYTLRSNKRLSFTSNVMAHVVCVCEKGFKSIYVNGELSGGPTLDENPPIPSTGALYIGGYIASSFRSKIRDVRAYSRALSPVEIQMLYKNPAFVPKMPI